MTNDSLSRITIEQCSCSPACKDWHLVGIGKFCRGSGFSHAEAKEIATTMNRARFPEQHQAEAVCPYVVTSPDTAEGDGGTSYCRLAAQNGAPPAEQPEDVVKRVAKAIGAADAVYHNYPPGEFSGHYLEKLQRIAKAAIAAMGEWHSADSSLKGTARSIQCESESPANSSEMRYNDAPPDALLKEQAYDFAMKRCMPNWRDGYFIDAGNILAIVCAAIDYYKARQPEPVSVKQVGEIVDRLPSVIMQILDAAGVKYVD